MHSESLHFFDEKSINGYQLLLMKPLIRYASIAGQGTGTFYFLVILVDRLHPEK